MDVVNPRQTDGIFPPQVEQPVSAAPLPDAETPSVPAAVENPTTPDIAMQTPDVASTPPQAPKIDLGAPVAVESLAPPEPTALPEQPTPEVSPAAAVEGSFAAGEHDTLEAAVAQPPVEKEIDNIGDVSATDAIAGSAKPLQSAVEQSIAQAQPTETPVPVPGTERAAAEEVSEAAPPPFVITPEESTPEPVPTVLQTEVAPPLDPITPIDKATAPAAPVVPVVVDAEPTVLPPNAAESGAPIAPEKIAEIREDLLATIDQILEEDRSKLRAAVEERLNKAA